MTLLKLIPNLSKYNTKVYCKNPNNVVSKAEFFAPNNTYVVFDFDGTMALAHGFRRSYMTSFGVFKMIWKDYEKINGKLYEKYHKIEVDPSIPDTIKRQKMGEWNERVIDFLVGKNIDSAISEIIKRKLLTPRNGLLELLNFFGEQSIPIIVSSAGLGNIIPPFIQSLGYNGGIYYHINWLETDHNGFITGLRNNESINTHNKGILLMKDEQFSKLRIEKPNLIVIGDSLSDLTIAEEVNDKSKVLSMGLLNDGHDKLDTLINNFDVVLRDGSSMNVISSNFLPNFLGISR